MTSIETACLAGALAAVAKAKARLAEKATTQADPADREVTLRTVALMDAIAADLKGSRK